MDSTSIWDRSKIRQARTDRNLTAASAADLLNITPEYIYMIEAGRKQPSQKLISRIAETYSLPITYFLRNEATLAKIVN